ncbi:hypothetical protein TNCT_266261 [Trichonephila clavata]|uniref:Uncharacterized protein n=1 Tax=Trichonephila clavata TaxID=2740835 RepID=A0A8X6FHU1_TRICU|nr:hypothetical protein TNCT_6741 [Trichonephila clavata]GFQ88267.1 hypothetical protein TNCT_266261 [Trichonephila clavata]
MNKKMKTFGAQCKQLTYERDAVEKETLGNQYNRLGFKKPRARNFALPDVSSNLRRKKSAEPYEGYDTLTFHQKTGK